MIQMRKFCNFRPFVLLAIAVILSTILSVFVVNPVLQMCIFIALILFSVASFIIYFVKKYKIFRFLSVFILVFALPFLTINYQTFKFDSMAGRYENYQLTVLGRISEHYEITRNGYLRIIVEDVETASGDIIENINGNIAIYTSKDYIDASNLDIGCYISAKLELDFNTISSKDEMELMYLSKNIVAGGFADADNIVIYNNKDVELSDIIKQKVIDTLDASDMKHADVAYAMMFGDTSIVDGNVNTIYQNTGIAHILAVSGLHVSAIVFVISFILKKLKVSQKVQIVTLAMLLGFYVYLCSFSISVIRSSFMAIILNYSYIRGKAYDRFSVLALLAMVILLFSPLELFNVSFVLSFMSVLSIILLEQPLSRLFNKVFYNKLASEFGLLFSLQLGITVVSVYYFNKLNPLTFLANLVSIPVVTFAFLSIILFAMIAMIFPFANVVCKFIGEIFAGVTQFNSYINSLNLGVVTSAIPAFVIPIVFMILFIISDYCFVSKKIKVGASALAVAGYIILFFI